MAAISRRKCLIGTAIAAISSSAFALSSSKPFRVGVVGHTGRGGMLDLWVLGSHLFNLACYFAGNPIACSANVMLSGRLAKKSDATQGAEGIGLMAGNEVHARFEMENGLVAYFDSIANAGNAAVPTYPPGFVTII